MIQKLFPDCALIPSSWPGGILSISSSHLPLLHKYLDLEFFFFRKQSLSITHSIDLHLPLTHFPRAQSS